MASTMVNFRVKEEFVVALDRAAAAVGMDRSAFIRTAVERAVDGDEPFVVRLGSTGEGVSKEERAKCPHPKAGLIKTTYGVRVCSSCGKKIA